MLAVFGSVTPLGAVTVAVSEIEPVAEALMVRPFAEHLIEIPAVSTLLQPLVASVPLQVFAAEVARARGYDVDKPRNLAKSVTVE